MDWNRDLTLVHLIEDHRFRLNGYAVFRCKDVRRWRAVPRNDFLAKSVRLLRLSPSRPRNVSLASLKEAITSVGTKFALITVHRERVNRGACEVGRLLRASQRTVKILSITPQAEWEGPESYRMKDVTLLEFGGAYEELLCQMAGRPKAMRKASRERSN